MTPEAIPQTPYLRLAEERAPTLSGSSGIRYAVLADPARSRVFLTLLANEGGGNFNKEVVALDDLEEAIADLPAGAAFGSKALKVAFIGKSNNNAGFMAAVLVHAGLLAPAAGVKHKLVKTGYWPVFEAGMLAREEGEPFLFPPTVAGLAPAPQAVTPTPLTAPEADPPSKKNRRGGNRLVPVGAVPAPAEEVVETVEGEEGGDANRSW